MHKKDESGSVSVSDKKHRAIARTGKLFPVSLGNEGVFRNVFLSSPWPAFLFKKEKGQISLIDFSMAALGLIMNQYRPPQVGDIESAMAFFHEMPEILSDISLCFSNNIPLSRDVSCQWVETRGYRYFKCTYTLPDPDYLVVYIEEVCEQQVKVSALRERQERMELAMDATRSGLWDLCIASGNLSINDTWATMLNYRPGEIKKHIDTWKDMLHPEDRDRAMESLQLHISGRTQNYRNEHRLLKKNGECIWVLDTGKVISKDAKGHPLRALGTKIDITDRKEMEVQLQVSNIQLKKQVEEKARDLISQELCLRRNMKKCKKQFLEIETLNQEIKRISQAQRGKKIGKNITSNISQMVIPYLDTIETSHSRRQQKRYIDLLKSNLHDLVSPMSRKLNRLRDHLTPTEIRVTDYVRHGKSTKQISDMMCVSTKTVKTHRRNIRRKLGINGKKINLVSYLRSLQ